MEGAARLGIYVVLSQARRKKPDSITKFIIAPPGEKVNAASKSGKTEPGKLFGEKPENTFKNPIR